MGKNLIIKGQQNIRYYKQQNSTILNINISSYFFFANITKVYIICYCKDLLVYIKKEMILWLYSGWFL